MNKILTLCVLILGTALPGAAQSTSSEVQILIHRGQAALDADRFDEAVAAFQQARELAPENLEASRGLVLSYLQTGDLRDAARIGDAAITRWPNDAQLQHWLGLVYFKGGQNARARVFLERSANLDGRHSDIHFDLALVLLAQEQYEPAAKELEQATKLDPSQALAHVLLGRAYQNTNRTLQAVEQFKAALRLDPKTPLGHYHLGFAYASLGRTAEAVVEYEKEMKQTADNPQVLSHLGHSLLEIGDLNSAVVNLKKAVQFDPSNYDAAYDLGKALLLDSRSKRGSSSTSKR